MSKSKENSPVMLHGKQFLGIREARNIAGLFDAINKNEKAATKLLLNTALSYYEAGNILNAAIKRFDWRASGFSVKAISDASGFPERRITIALKIFRAYENNPDILKGLTLRDALKLIAPPPPAGEEGYNRIDLGGDPGQLDFNFGELFELPATGNLSLKNYRTVGDMLTEIIVVRRTQDNLLTSKRFARFFEDIPQNPALRSAFKTMSMKTQAAIEDYLAALEQEEA